MRILVASDSFKDGCSSIEACEAIARGIRSANIEVEIDLCPISDGGEGAVEILQYHLGGELIEVEVSNPLFKRIKAHYLLLGNSTAFIEMAQASGLELLTDVERNPMNTSTFGTGELIEDALDRDCKEIIISVGGSATNDLGMGMASALGYQFFDAAGNVVAPIGYNMSHVVDVDFSKVDKGIEATSFTVITDVINPLYGPEGAAYIFGRQKGADDQSIKYLDNGLKHLWILLTEQNGKLNNDTLGYGAAGGLGGGSIAFLNADIQPGFAKIAELINLKEKLDLADIVITGEGHLDGQTLDGKVISGIAAMAREKQLVVFCGKNSLTDEEGKTLGIKDVIEISSTNQVLEEALKATKINLEQRGKQWAANNL